MKKILFIILFMLFNISSVSALTYGGCDYSSISRLKSLISNINISYDYHIIDNKAYFDVTLNNIPDGVYFVDKLSRNTYTYSDTNNGEITIKDYDGTSGSYKFYSSLDACKGTSLGTKYYNFPTYNTYYSNDLCSDIPEFSLCQKWVGVNYSYDEFEKLVNDYKNKNSEEKPQDKVTYNKSIIDKIVDIYVKYYYLILGGIIIVCGLIIIIKRRKDSFNLK